MIDKSFSEASLVDAARNLGDVVSTHRSWSETHGRLHKEVVDAFVDAGFARAFAPRSLGGLETDPVTCARITETLAQHDPCVAWFVMVTNAARLLAATWPESLVQRLWGDDVDCVVAASGNRALDARRVEGGFQVSGRNGFVSGCHYAQWFMTPIVCAQERFLAVLPMHACEIADNWHVLGMRGTGSNDVLVSDVFVPADQTVPIVQDEFAAPNALHTGSLYRCPGRVLFATYVPVTLVLASQALEVLRDLVRDKTPAGSGTRLKDQMLAQTKFGKALALHRSARAYFYAELDRAWQRAQRGAVPTDEDKADLYLAGTHAVQASAQTVRLVSDAAGTAVVYDAGPLQQIVRDMETLRHHGFANESRYASVTQLLWDSALDYPLILR